MNTHTEAWVATHGDMPLMSGKWAKRRRTWQFLQLWSVMEREPFLVVGLFYELSWPLQA